MKIRFYNVWKGNPTWHFTLIDAFVVFKECPSLDFTLFNFTLSLEWGKWTKNWKEKQGAIEDHQHGIA